MYEFCDSTLSATYFVAVKDRLYCDRPDSARRRRAQRALYTIADGLCRLLAPIMVHTADEAYRALHAGGAGGAGGVASGENNGAANAATAAPGGGGGGDERCVHLQTYLSPTGAPADPAWAQVFAARAAAMQFVEQARREQGVDNPLDMGVTLPDADGTLSRFDREDLADLLGVSRVHLDPTAGEIRIADLRSHARCERSWKRDGTVRARSSGAMLSDRDAEALGVE